MFKFLVFVLLFLNGQYLNSQTVTTLSELESEFQKNKVKNIAEYYNIDIAKANLIQSKIWEQPYISASINFYNPDRNQFFDAGAYGEKDFAIEQLIYLGGKKGKEIDFNASNLEIAELQFEIVLRNLTSQIRKEYYDLYAENEKLKVLDKILIKLQANTAELDKSKVIYQKLKVKNEILEIKKQISIINENISKITGLSKAINPVVEADKVVNLLNSKSINLSDYSNQIIENNIEIKLSKLQIENSKKYLDWQESMSVPDLNLGFSYDQRGGAFFHQVNLTFGFNVPLWDKNEGNIQLANINKSQVETENLSKEEEILDNLKSQINEWENIKSIINVNDYNGLVSEINALEENISNTNNTSISELIDLLENYKETKYELINLHKNIIQTSELIANTIGKPIK